MNSPKREQILSAMLEEVGASGYEAASVRMVLDRSGAYRQAFYDNFSDKADCYLAAYEVGVARLEAAIVATATSAGTWRERLRLGLGAMLDRLETAPDTGRALFVEVHASGQDVLAVRAAAMRRAVEAIEAAREETGEFEHPPAIASEGIAAGIHSVIHSRLSSGATEGLGELLPEFVYFAVLPYFGPEVASAEMRLAQR